METAELSRAHLKLARPRSVGATPPGPGHTNLYPGNIALLSFVITSVHIVQDERARLCSPPPIPRLYVVGNQICKDYMTNSFPRKFPFSSSITCLALCARVSGNRFGGASYLKSNEGWSGRNIFFFWREKKNHNRAMQNLIPTPEWAWLFLSLCKRARLHRRSAGLLQMKGSTVALGAGSPHTERTSDWLLSYRFNLNPKNKSLSPSMKAASTETRLFQITHKNHRWLH